MRSLLKDREKSFPKISGPHLLASSSSSKIMWGFFFALIPIWISFMVSYGVQTVVVFLSSVGVSSAIQFIFGKRSWAEMGRGTFIGGFLALLLPQSISWQGAALGALIGSLYSHAAFGGLGQTIFHPSLVGYAALFLLSPALFSEGPNRLGMIQLIAIALAAIFLRYRNWISLRPALFFIVFLSVISSLIDKNSIRSIIESPVLLLAFFFFTDSLVMPVSRKGRLAFSVLAALCTGFLKMHGNFFEAALGSLLFLNAYVPILDRWADNKLKVRNK